MTGHLPPEFFNTFFTILRFTPEEAISYHEKIDELSQRKFLQSQLEMMPDFERVAFNTILEQEGVSAQTINDFLEERLEDEVREVLWQDSLLFIWQEILTTVRHKASAEQKRQIKALVKHYLVTD